jgi:hypothetical protein
MMIRFAGKRSLARLLRRLRVPPPSPRRHFSKTWGYVDDEPGAGNHRGRQYRGEHNHRWRRPAGS